MKKILPLLLLIASLSLVNAESLPVYASDFDRGTAGWTGRAGTGKDVPPLKIDTENSKDDAKPYLWILTDGQLGCGFVLKPTIQVEANKEYIVSFWFKSESGLAATYHIAGPNGGDGENSKAWRGIPKSDGDWTRVEYAFQANKTSIGLEIGVNAKNYEPSKIYIYDVKIIPNF